MEPGTSLYNMPIALRARGRAGAVGAGADAGRGGAAARGAAHGLRGRRRPGAAGDPAAGGFSIPFFDLSPLPEAEREAALAAALEAEARRPFDLARGPLFRAVLWRLGEREHVLLVAMHHIVSDGWSLGVLVREVAALYAAFLEDRPSPLPELPVQYADFAVVAAETGSPARCSSGSWPIGASGWPGSLRFSTCRPIGRGRRSGAPAALCVRWRYRLS